MMNADAVAQACACPAAGRLALAALLAMMDSDAATRDVRARAYLLATVQHETWNRFAPIEEVGRGAGKPYGAAVQVSDPATQTEASNVYYGRGYVQLTWQTNYLRVGELIGMGSELEMHPERALEPEIAYRVASAGMTHGAFTGKKFADYFTAAGTDYLQARRIINGMDCAELIAGYAEKFERVLRSGVSSAQ
jgi:predicted chitinase